MHKILIACFAFTAFIASHAVAADAVEVKQEDVYVNISTTETEAVQCDILTSNLYFEAEDSDSAKVQGAINAKIAQALAAVKLIPRLAMSTEQYSVYQADVPQKSKETKKVWRGSQGLSIKGSDTEALLKLTGELQGMGFLTSGLSYSLSSQKADETRDAMLDKAIDKLNKKAEQIAAKFGKSKVEFTSISIDNPPQALMTPVFKTSAFSAAPRAEPGFVDVTLTVFGSAVLKK
jgi:predicted secreted protein